MKNYTVGDFQADENILLVTDSQDIKAVANHCNFDASQYGFLLVKVAKHPGKNKFHKSFFRYLSGQGDYAFGYEDLWNLFYA